MSFASRFLLAIFIILQALLTIASCGGTGSRHFPALNGAMTPSQPVVFDFNRNTIADVAKANDTSRDIDSDGDGLKDNIEAGLGTDPLSKDSDCDGLSDSFELFFRELDIPASGAIASAFIGGKPPSLVSDADGDGVNDGYSLDTDGDKIPNKLEMEGYYFSSNPDYTGHEYLPDSVKQLGLIDWDGKDITKLYFKSDPTQKYSDYDPYDDLMEATGVNFPPAVVWPGRDPLVPASPDIQVNVEAYTITTIAKISNSYSKETMNSWSNTVEHKDSTETKHHFEANADGEYGSDGWKVSGHVGTTKDTDHIVSTTTTDTHSGYTKEDWDTATTVQTDQAAKVAFDCRITNSGTAPASAVSMTFNVLLGDEIIATVTPSDVVDYLGVGNVYPSSGSALHVDKNSDGTFIFLSLDQLHAIDIGVPLNIQVIDVTASTNAFDPFTGQIRNMSWKEWEDNIEKITSDVYVDLGDGNMRRSRVYTGMVGKDSNAPVVSIYEAVLWSLRSGQQNQVSGSGIKYLKDDGTYATLTFNGWRFEFDSLTYSQLDKANFLNTVITPRNNDNRAVIVAMAPPESPLDTPQFGWASINFKTRAVTARVNDYFALSGVAFYASPSASPMPMSDLVGGVHTGLYTVNLPSGYSLTGKETIVATNDMSKTSQAGGNSKSLILALPMNWCMYGHDPARTGLGTSPGPSAHSGSGPPSFNKKWQHSAGNFMNGTPVVGADGTVYVSSSDKNVYALNPSNGSEKWHYTTGLFVGVSPAVGVDGTVYAGSWDGCLYALHPDGTLKWKYAIDQSVPVLGEILVTPGNGICFSAGDLYMLNADGSLRWKASSNPSDEPFFNPAAGADGTIYAGSADHNLYAFDRDGHIKWKYDAGSRAYGGPAISPDGTIYFASEDGQFHALTDADSHWIEKWHTPISTTHGPAIGADGTLYICSISGTGSLTAVKDNGGSPSVLWHYNTSNIISSPSIDSNGYIYFGCTDSVICLKPSGSLYGGFWASDWFNGAPSIVNSVMYASCRNNNAYSFGS